VLSRSLELVALLTLAVLVVAPARRAAERFLVRWGLPRPTKRQAQLAARHLRQRRLLYPICWVFGPAVVLVVAELRSPGPGTETQRALALVASVLAAVVLAELVAAVRGRGTADRRRWRELAPWWAVAVHVAVLGMAAAQGLAVAAAGLLGAAGVYSVVLLAAHYRADPDDELDPILRTRAARAAVGAGIGLALALLYLGSTQHPAGPRAGGTAGLVAATAAGLAAWFAATLPPWRLTEPAAPAPER
jgi:hypothetical protein